MSPGRRPASTSSRSRWATSAPRRAATAARRARRARARRPARPSPSVSVTQQLDRRRARGRVGVEQPQLAVVGRRRRRLARAARDERLERLAEHGGEGGVEDVEQLPAPSGSWRAARAPAPPRASRAARGRSHVGVAEAVDRLELVADREQVVALERLEHVELQAVRVLELVDHQQREALAPALRAPRRRRSRSRTPQLEVLEVDRRARGLAVRVLGGEAVAAARRAARSAGARVVVGAGLPVGVPGRRGRPRTPASASAFAPRAELRRVELAGRRHAAGARARQRARAGRERAAPLADADRRRRRPPARPPRPRARRPAPRRRRAPGARPGSAAAARRPRLRSVSCAPSTRSRRPWP